MIPVEISILAGIERLQGKKPGKSVRGSLRSQVKCLTLFLGN